MTSIHPENVVGALALTLSDQIVATADTFLPRHEPAKAIAFIGRETGMTIQRLSDQMRLSHAATLRMVDRLVQDGMVCRSASAEDRRAVLLSLTGEGRRIYADILVARSACVTDALNALTKAERAQFGQLASKILAALAKTPDQAAQSCRFCDVPACKNCPVGA